MTAFKLTRLWLVALVLWTSACATQTTLQQTDDPANIQHDNYVPWMRVLGLYPLTRIPVALGYARWQGEYRAEVKAWTGLDAMTWAPLDEGPKLVRQHAPVFLIEETTPFDQFGYPEAGPDQRVVVDTSRPTVTWRLGETSFRGETLQQISYTLWFPGRPKLKAFDPLSGSLDIIIFRVTLGKDGRAILYDTIHGCGCYHLFFPVPPTRRKPMPEDDDLREAAFALFEAPILKAGERLGIRITAGAHYVVGLEAIERAQGASYQLASAEVVAHGIAHLYDRNGILPQSKRLERFLLWPMGIRSPGAMRAWGHHATAFVGKRHFDDQDLLDRAFE